MTPGWHLVVHIVQLACLAGLGALIWRHWPDSDEAIAAIDADLLLVEADQDALWDYAAAIVRYLYELTGQPLPDDGEPTEEHPAVEPDEPEVDTAVSHPADLGARMLTLLHKREPQTPGRHRTEAPAGNVHELTDGIETRLLPQMRTDSFVGGGPVGEGPVVAHQTKGEA